MEGWVMQIVADEASLIHSPNHSSQGGEIQMHILIFIKRTQRISSSRQMNGNVVPDLRRFGFLPEVYLRIAPCCPSVFSGAEARRRGQVSKLIYADISPDSNRQSPLGHVSILHPHYANRFSHKHP